MASILRRLIVCLIALLAYGLSPAGLSPARSEILVGAALPATGPNSWSWLTEQGSSSDVCGLPSSPCWRALKFAGTSL